MKTFLKILIIILVLIGVLALVVGLSALEGWIFMLLWNYVLCAIFPSIPTLSFWLAWGLLFLINIIGSAFKKVVYRSGAD